MQREYNKKTAVVEDRHIEFIEEHNINFSMLTRSLLDEYMQHVQQLDEFELSGDITNQQ